MSEINEIEKLGLSNIGKVYYNLSYDALFEHEIKNNEGTVTAPCARIGTWVSISW